MIHCLVDDTHVIVRGGKFWLYFKGRSPFAETRTRRSGGLQSADHPAGPILQTCDRTRYWDSGHTVCVWPHREGVGALVDNAGPERFTVQYAMTGFTFSEGFARVRPHGLWAVRSGCICGYCLRARHQLGCHTRTLQRSTVYCSI